MQLESRRRARVLDFDCECRPIAWYGGDWVTKQPTAIAWKFVGERGPVEVAVVGESFDTRQTLEEEAAMLEAFRVAFNAADIVTGHYIRGFDLPLLNGALMRLGLPLLESKMTHDTKSDLVRGQGLSKSQENLGAMFELKHPKVSMNTTLWLRGNILTPDGIEATRKRVVGDVRQHVELRAEMLRRGLLGPVVSWSGGAGSDEGYLP
jgi:DNA polymerase elongation subunit (family B)